jgi:hypothetical protein
LGSTVACLVAFAARPAADDAAERFFLDFDIEILRSVEAASRRTTEAPPRPSGRRGGIPLSGSAPGIDNTTAPIAAESQSFLDHVIAQYGGT